ncbi:MAG: YdcF family protein [Sulfurovum sp.]|nr:YdcF family protein [Sulfurovum sp.]
MQKIIFGFTAFLVFLTFSFLNMGKWMDVTEEPIKSDMIVCLGGGTIERVKKSIELLEEGYIEKQIFLLLGESWYNQPYIKKNYPNLPVIIDESPKNTKEEVLYIKQYMQKHGYQSALIVTDPPHSGRVSLLTSLISLKGDEKMTFVMISSDVLWWDAKNYYKSERARSSVMYESVKMLYHFVFERFMD